jgi:hypothetical protein
LKQTFERNPSISFKAIRALKAPSQSFPALFSTTQIRQRVILEIGRKLK